MKEMKEKKIYSIYEFQDWEDPGDLIGSASSLQAAFRKLDKMLPEGGDWEISEVQGEEPRWIIDVEGIKPWFEIVFEWKYY